MTFLTDTLLPSRLYVRLRPGNMDGRVCDHTQVPNWGCPTAIGRQADRNVECLRPLYIALSRLANPVKSSANILTRR